MQPQKISRRGFDLVVLIGMPLVYGAGILVGAVRYLYPKKSKRLPKLDVGPLDAFVAGKIERKQFNGRPIYILHDGKELHALDATCTHLSCSVNWQADKKQFLCPCHMGLFSISGQRVSGPPPHPLRKQNFEVDSKGRVVLLDSEGAA